MSYSSTIIDPVTKKSATLVSATLEEHTNMLLDALDTVIFIQKEAQSKLTRFCAPIAIIVGFYLLVAPLIAVGGLIAVCIYFTLAPARINPFRYVRQARAYVWVYQNEINRSIRSGDAQILTPER